MRPIVQGRKLDFLPSSTDYGKPMTNLSIVYFSGSGHTTKMAEATAKGAGAVAGTQAHVLPIQSEDS